MSQAVREKISIPFAAIKPYKENPISKPSPLTKAEAFGKPCTDVRHVRKYVITCSFELTRWLKVTHLLNDGSIRSSQPAFVDTYLPRALSMNWIPQYTCRPVWSTYLRWCHAAFVAFSSLTSGFSCFCSFLFPRQRSSLSMHASIHISLKSKTWKGSYRSSSEHWFNEAA